jgi:hypothetical protein
MPRVNFDAIRTSVQTGDYAISVHAFERMRRRGITLDDLESVIINGEIIERDADAMPYPKCIFLGYTVLKGELLHVVCSLTPHSRVVTVYFPDEDEWARGRFRLR